MKRTVMVVLIAGSLLLAAAGCRVWLNHSAGWEIDPVRNSGTNNLRYHP